MVDTLKMQSKVVSFNVSDQHGFMMDAVDKFSKTAHAHHAALQPVRQGGAVQVCEGDNERCHRRSTLPLARPMAR